MAQNAGQISRREPGWTARDDRMPTYVEARVTRADGSVVAVSMSDISREGCRLDYEGVTLNIGEWIELESDGECAVRGQVRWALGGAAGVRFEKL